MVPVVYCCLSEVTFSLCYIIIFRIRINNHLSNKYRYEWIMLTTFPIAIPIVFSIEDYSGRLQEVNYKWCQCIDMSVCIAQCLKHYIGVSACQHVHGKFYSFGNLVHVI